MVDDKETNLLDSLIRAAQSKPKKEQATGKNSSNTLGKIVLFTKKQEINVLKDRANAEPAVRQKRVDAIREAIQNETYRIRGELVARSILKSHLLDELLR
jgi:anti-sigma28 factor (negative regulator of flagellin synthesis)